MSSTFGSLTTVKLGIYAAQKGLDVTGNNITNINTNGYTRQRLERPLRHRAARLHPARKGRRGALLRRDGPETEPVAHALADRSAAQRLPGAHRRG